MAFTVWKYEEKSRHKFQKGSFESVLSTIKSRICAANLISKCLFGVFNSPKNEQKQFDLMYHSI